MKRILIILFISIMILSLVASGYAVENNNEQSEIVLEETEELDEITELSLDAAIEYALQHNKDMIIQDLNVNKVQLGHEQTMNQVEDFEDLEELPGSIRREIFKNTGIETVDRYLFKLGVVERSSTLSLNIANWNKQIKENEIRYNVEKAYYDLLLAEEQMEIAKESLALANKQYEQSKKMYELGTIAQQQLLSVELAVSQAQSGYDAAQMAYELQKMSFNNTLGLPLDQDVLLTEKIEYKEHEEINLEEAITEGLENNASLKVAEENYELAKLTLEATKVKYPEITYKYREQEIEVEKAAKALEMAKNGIEMAVRSAYLNLITSEKQIKTYEKAVEQAQRALELAELSFELGQNTSNDVTQARIELMNAKKSLAQQIHAYNMALLDFKYSTGIGKTQIVGGY